MLAVVVWGVLVAGCFAFCIPVLPAWARIGVAIAYAVAVVVVTATYLVVR